MPINDKNTYKWKISTEKQDALKVNGVVLRDVLTIMHGTLVVSDGLNSDDSVTHTVHLQPPKTADNFKPIQDFTYDEIVDMFTEAVGVNMIEMLESSADNRVAAKFVPTKTEGPSFEPPAES